ncbi:MAG: glycosyltransferase family 2 protein [Fimbriimonadaceae bacterium]|nr:glycosyltransferase family 2 protein [Fimbriimonadaceae bacterium]
MEQPDLTILIPALNEEATIREVLERCLAVPLSKQIVVINDGSTDSTAEILKAFGEKIEVITNPKPSGKGNAIRKALNLIKGKTVIVQDADLEYSPEQIPTLIQPILDGSASVVFGTRFAKGYPSSMALPNKLVNFLLAISVRILFGKKISDEATCYKALRSDVLQAMNLECQRFEFCPEVTAKTFRLGLSIIEVPIDYVARNKKEGKKIRWYDAPEAFWTLLRYRFWKPTQQLQEQSKQSASTHD